MESRTAPCHPIRLGRPKPSAADYPIAQSSRVGDDLKLFATTFVAGFLFITLYLF